MPKTPKRKIEIPVGQAYTIGKPTMAVHGLGRFVVVTGLTPSRVLVRDRDNPEKTAEIKYANLGSLVDADGTLRSMIDGKPWKSQAKKLTQTIPDAVRAAFAALKEFQSNAGASVGAGQARKLKRLQKSLTNELKASGVSMETAAAVLG